MKLLILGASGGCGRWLVKQALEEGHEVTALVRPSTAYQAPPGVTVVRGDVLDADLLAEITAGKDAVLSCLGLRRAGRSPWSRLLSPPDLMTRVAELLATVLPHTGVRRLVVVSAAGVGDSADKLSLPVGWLVRQGNIAVAYRDLMGMERALAASSLDWLAVRPVSLVDGPPSSKVTIVDRYRVWSIVRRADVAAWMLQAVQRPDPFDRHTEMIGSK